MNSNRIEKAIVLIGANQEEGSLNRYALNIFLDKVIAIADNNPQKIGIHIEDHIIESVENALKAHEDKVFYVITTMREYSSIEAQLQDAGLQRGIDFEYLFCLTAYFNPNKYAWFRRTIVKDGVFYPKRLRIELSSYCNLKCVYCRYHSKYFNSLPKGCNSNLSMELLKRIIDEAREIGTIKEIMNVQKGEMFCNPLWHEMLLYIRDNIEIQRFHFSTNGMLLDKNAVDKLTKIGFPELVIVISLDGTTEDENERLRSGSNYAQIKENIKYLLEHLNGKTQVIIQNAQIMNAEMFDNYKKQGCVKIQDDNYLIQDFGNKVDIVSYATLATGNAQIDDAICNQENSSVKMARLQQYIEGCDLPLDEIAVDSDGYVVVCGCEPWGELYRLGNIQDEKMINIWNNDVMSEIRADYEIGREVALCKYCISNAMSVKGSRVLVRN